LSGINGRLVCHAPDAISGLVEVYGIGPRPLEFESAMVTDLLVRLVTDEASQRFQEERTELLAGCSIPCFEFAATSVKSATFAVASRFLIPPFR
jgi:hypothetical protein